MPNDAGRPLKTVENAVEIVDAIEEREGADIEAIAAATGLARSTVHGYVTTLERHGYLVREGSEYDLGLAFLVKGGRARVRTPERRAAIEAVDDLASRTGERAQFVVEGNGRGVYVHTARGEEAIQVDAWIGKTVYLHASSAGKAILAELSPSRVDGIVDRWGLPAHTPETITSRDELDRELDRVRERGYAENDGESIAGLRAVGVAVRSGGDLVGAISLSGPTHRMKDDRLEEVAGLVAGAAEEVRLDLEYR